MDSGSEMFSLREGLHVNLEISKLSRISSLILEEEWEEEIIEKLLGEIVWYCKYGGYVLYLDVSKGSGCQFLTCQGRKSHVAWHMRM